LFSGLSGRGLYLILRDLLPYLEALRTGVLKTRGHSPRKVVRADEPERFKTLLRNRTDGMLIGLLAIAFGILWAFLGLFALLALFPIGALMTAILSRSKKSTLPVLGDPS
jgi:hypothetical protein